VIKRIFFIWILICLNIFFYCAISYAAIVTKEKDDFEIELYSITGNTTSDEKEKKAITILQKTFGYSGDKFLQGENTMRFRTKIKIIEESTGFNKGKFIIQIGEDARSDDKDYKPIILPPKSLRNI